MKRLIPILLLLTLLAACAPNASNSDQPTSNPDEPVSSDEPVPPLKFDDTFPRPADKNLLRENIYVESTELLTMESYPLQFMLTVAGNLPTPCNQLRVDVRPPDADNKILVEVYSLVAPDSMCTEVLQPFSQNIPLGSFPTGHYTIWINGEKVAEFDA